MLTQSRRTIPAALAIAALGLAGAAPSALARHGADDPAGHARGASHSTRADHDGGARKHRGHHGRHHRGGNDDGPNHT
ncbi:MAG TPA: hypothetical protein VK501_24010 [Baekduia sp.]|uniref:hypothetical protein n=1 Tax=Baekduia sp. TaxID=2600305 RepID=UPI002B81D5F5|nr:hypothetical protein [Baekduia sp.]HMJ36993.1 hypothetical protein [Baekduia sp.]